MDELIILDSIEKYNRLYGLETLHPIHPEQGHRPGKGVIAFHSPIDERNSLQPGIPISATHEQDVQTDSRLHTE